MKKTIIVLLCWALVGTLAHGAVTRGPYLQKATSESVIVRFSTDTAAVGRVFYGTRVDKLNRSVDGTLSTTDHEIALTGLRHDTRYYYSVGTTGEPPVTGNAGQYFVTAPRAGAAKATRIWALGDSGTANANAAAVRDAYVSFTGSTHTNVLLMLGDNAYNTGTNAQYQAAVFDMYPDQLRTTPVWPVIGNHDLFDGVAGTYPYFDIFTLPTLGEAGGRESFSEAYYSFDHANIHFIALDSFQSDRSVAGPMMTWLEEDLMLTTADWVIAFWHHPPYSRGSHDSDNPLDSAGRMRDMRENAVPLLDSYGVDLILTGHSHSYERSVLLDSHYGTSDTLQNQMILDEGADGIYEKPSVGSVPHEGAVYVVAGSSGKTSGGTFDHPVMVAWSNTLGSMVVDVDGNVLTGTFLESTGSIGDTFTIIKGGAICAPQGSDCADHADCCSNKCRGPQGGKICR